MPKKSGKAASKPARSERNLGEAKPQTPALHREVKAIGVVVVGILLLLSVLVPGALGRVGGWIQAFLVGMFGFGAFILPGVMIAGAIFVLLAKQVRVLWAPMTGLVTAILSLLHIFNRPNVQGTTAWERLGDVFSTGYLAGGGIYGMLFGDILHAAIDRTGSIIVLFAVILIFAVLLTGRSFIYLMKLGYYESRDALARRRERIEAERHEEELEEIAHGLAPLPERKKKQPEPEPYNPYIEYNDEDFDEEDDLPEVRLLQEELVAATAVKPPPPIFTRTKPARAEGPSVVPLRPHSAEIAVLPKKTVQPIAAEPMIEPPEEAYGFDADEITLRGLVDGATRSDTPPWEEEDVFDEFAEEYDDVTAPTFSTPKAPSFEEYRFPSPDLLEQYEIPENAMETPTQILDNSRKLVETLKSFKVEAKVIAVSVGPAVTRYDISPGPGVKVSAIANLSNDLALALAAQGIRIEAPIPGKSAVGIEIPNKEPQPVFLRDIIESDKFINYPFNLTFAVGKDIAGEPVLTDIARMPHLLIAGATGSGKSVCINTLIISILYKARPDEVKLLLIDPKVVELSVYNGIPHLLIPVVTEPKKASGALSWAVAEMENRYNLFAESGNRDLKGYNRWMAENEEPPLPQIVIIIDELADLMMAAKGEVEESICRLAQKARAAGLHLIVATQRPSVDVITGLIKANIPSRLAFAVSSGIDSRTVLDMYGAEKLLGRGDMLFLPMGQNKPIRVQGSYVSEGEVEAVVSFLRAQTKVEHSSEMIEQVTSPAARLALGGEVDELFHEAIEFLLTKGKASTSVLQRQFRIGYNRASRLMEDLEKRGIVGPEDGVKPRKVTITRSEYLEVYKNGS